MDGRAGVSVTGVSTVTHARIRALQGDVDGARRILREILAARPEDAQARILLGEIGSTPAHARPAEPADEPLPPPVPGDPTALVALFGARDPAVGRPKQDRLVALRDWLEHIRNVRERERAR